MYGLSRITRAPVVRRQPAYWQMTEDLFRPLVEMMNSPLRGQVRETDGAYVWNVELPGYEPDEIDLSIQDGTITLSAEHKEENGENGAAISRQVRRSFTVDGIDEDGITAGYKNGILQVTLPREKAAETPEARKIKID